MKSEKLHWEKKNIDILEWINISNHWVIKGQDLAHERRLKGRAVSLMGKRQALEGEMRLIDTPKSNHAGED